MEFVLMVGFPGSGKSHVVKTKYQDYVCLELDSLYPSLFGAPSYILGKQDKSLIKLYKDIEMSITSLAFREGRSVVIDRTNLNSEVRARYIMMLSILKQMYTFRIVAHLVDTPIDVCIERNKNRLGMDTDKTERDIIVIQKSFDKLVNRYEKPSREEGFDELRESKFF